MAKKAKGLARKVSNNGISTAITKLKRELLSPQEAEFRTRALRERANTWAGEWWAIGEETYCCLMEHVPESRKKKQSATAWLNEVFGTKWHTIRRALASTKALRDVPIETRKKMSEGKATLLATKLPPQLRTEKKWIDMAADEEVSNENFKKAVFAERRAQGVVDEEMVPIAEAYGLSRVPKTFAEIIQDNMKRAAEIENLNLEEKSGKVDAMQLIHSHFQTSFGAPGQAIDVEATGASAS